MYAQEDDGREDQGTYLSPGMRPGMDDSLGSLKLQLDHNEVIQDILHTLKNEEPIALKDGSVVWQAPKNVRPLINDQGIVTVLTVLRSRINKVNILSDFDEKVIERMLNDIHEDLTDDFFMNFDFYEIKDIATASEIVSLVTDTVYGTLRKGYQGNYMKLLRHIHMSQELNTSSGGSRRQGGLARESGGGVTESIMRLFGRR